MKKAVFLLIAGLLATIRVLAQTDTSHTKPASNIVTAGILIPFGGFAETHIGGISLGYSRSHHRFGILNALPEKMIGFIANAGADHYFGKKEKVAGYDVKYSGYTYLHIAVGVIHNPSVKTNITLTAGPSLGIYKSNARAGFLANLDGNYYVTGKIAITPGIIYMKHAEANALWSVSLRASYNF